MRNIIIIIYLFISSLSHFCYGQTREETDLLSDTYRFHSHEHDYAISNDQSSFIGIVSKQVFWFYKVFISSQDYNSCSFSPSCSVYAMQSIQKQGFFPGVFDAFDRLTRCNGMSPEHYSIDTERHLLKDEVTTIKYEKIH
jgi:putative component of membrane protein insertase Oxa1/YidC/SpoIIIJ protein YidD